MFGLKCLELFCFVVDIDLCFVFLSILIISLIVTVLIKIIIIILIPLNIVNILPGEEWPYGDARHYGLRGAGIFIRNASGAANSFFLRRPNQLNAL